MHLRSSHTPAQALSHRCAARRSPGSTHRKGTVPVFACASWLHRGGMAAPSPWRCTWLERVLPGSALWIGHCLWQDGTRPSCAATRLDAYSPARRARIIDPGSGRWPPGRRFVLHWTSGPLLRCAAPSPGPVRPLERGLPLLLRASAPPSRPLAQPPPPLQPWPPSGVHFHPLTRPFASFLPSPVCLCQVW